MHYHARKCSFTWYYYIDSCNTRYAPNRRIWHLKFQNFPGVLPPRPRRWNLHFRKRSPKSKIATTPLLNTRSARFKADWSTFIGDAMRVSNAEGQLTLSETKILSHLRTNKQIRRCVAELSVRDEADGINEPQGADGKSTVSRRHEQQQQILPSSRCCDATGLQTFKPRL